jgi:hypothetical protein
MVAQEKIPPRRIRETERRIIFLFKALKFMEYIFTNILFFYNNVK